MPQTPASATLFRNARLPDGRTGDLAVRDGRFVEPNTLPHDPAHTIDLGGFVVLPPFVDEHIHLDKSFVGDRWRPHRPRTIWASG